MSGGGSASPPRLATRLLRAALPRDARGRSIVGDLLEEWHARPPGAARAAWYWRECLRVGVRYLLVPRRLPGVPPGRGAAGGRARRPPLPPLDDLRHGLRSAVRAPTLTALTVAALGVGVAAPTIMYSLLVGVTRDLPVPDPDALVHVGRRYTPSIVRGAELDRLRPLLEAPAGGGGAGLSSVGAFRLGRWDVADEGGFPERRRGAAVTPGVFRTLGVEPALGRAPTEEDAARGEAVVVLSDAVWKERFGGDAGVLGRRVRLDGVPHAVVGVMPPGFAFPDDAEVWLPLDTGAGGAGGSVELVARLAEGATLEGLRQRVAALAAGTPGEGAGPAAARPLAAQRWSDRSIGPQQRSMLRLMVLLVSFVLVIAAANVAHLFLARALTRRTQAAVRRALGAGRWRVVRQHLAEAVVMAGLGGVAGLAVASAGVRGLAAAMAPRLGWWMEIRLDPAVVLFSAALMALAALATGIVPALHASRVDVSAALRDGGRGTTGGRTVARLTGALVVGQVALTCALLVVAGLLTRGALRATDTDGTFATASVLVAGYEVDARRHAGEADVDALHRELATRAAARAGVAAAGLVSHVPGIYAPRDRVEVEGVRYDRPEDRPATHVVLASPGFLDALGVAPLRGRDLRWSDGRAAPPAALVNEAFVREHLGGRDPLGLRVRVAGDDAAGAASEEGWATVVGVVPALGLRTGRDPDETGIYLPLVGAHRSASLMVRAAPGTAPATLAPAVRAMAAAVDPDLALDVRSLEGHLRANRDMETLFAALFLFFGASGLVIAAVGLYGLVAFTVGRRVRELGIRAALGARPATVVWAAVRGGTVQAVVGLGLGLGLAALVAPRLGDLFMGYRPGDPVAYGLAALVLLAAGAGAAAGPARRARAMDVAEVLRGE